jgi:reactive intermediate/imine deaminase
MSNNKAIIHTSNAPSAIGPYSQAVKINNTVYISGQIPLVPETMEMIEGDITAKATRVFESLKAIAEEAGGSLNDAVKLNISLTDLDNFAAVNEVMTQYLAEPYPARACVAVAALPRGAEVEIEAILAL